MTEYQQHSFREGSRDEPHPAAEGGGISATWPTALSDFEMFTRRVAIHESGHIAAARAFGRELGGATIIPGAGFAGRVWGTDGEATCKLEVPSLAPFCQQISPWMPKIGESRTVAADVYVHCHFRIIDFVAGCEAERIFFPDTPCLSATSDDHEADAFARLICGSAQAAEAFIAYARVEASSLIAEHRHVVVALADALIEHDTLDGIQIDQVIAIALAAFDLEQETTRRAYWSRVREESPAV